MNSDIRIGIDNLGKQEISENKLFLYHKFIQPWGSTQTRMRQP